MKKDRYWVQTVYAVICPDGSAEDYLFSLKKAKEMAKDLNIKIKEFKNERN